AGTAWPSRAESRGTAKVTAASTDARAPRRARPQPALVRRRLTSSSGTPTPRSTAAAASRPTTDPPVNGSEPAGDSGVVGDGAGGVVVGDGAGGVVVGGVVVGGVGGTAVLRTVQVTTAPSVRV